jgi:hypothetical protein
MQKPKKISVVALIIVGLLFSSAASPALAQEYFESEEPAGGEMLFDFVCVRPIGIVATTLGAVTFVLSLPFSALGDNVDTAGQKLVKEPAQYTFTRPLGRF